MSNNTDIIQKLEMLMESMCFDAIDIAAQYCDPKQDDSSCAHYHGIRFLLHQLGARTTLPCQYEVFYSDLKTMLGRIKPAQKTLRILISGAADFVIPALVSFAAKEAGIAAELTIIDRCQTPLQFCSKAARQFGFNWQYQQSDIVDLEFDERFDLIVTDRLIGHIPPEFRLHVFNKWATLLSEKGQLLTMVSLRPQGKSSPKETEAMLGKLQGFEDQCKPSARYSMQILTQMTARYTKAYSRYPVRSKASLEEMFESSQLKIKSINPLTSNYLAIKGKDPIGLVKLIAQAR